MSDVSWWLATRMIFFVVVGNAYDFHGGWQRIRFFMVVGNAYDVSLWLATCLMFHGGWQRI